MTNYYFVRHGESTANVDGVSAGWTDVPLTEQGRQQAHEVANHIESGNFTFDAIISSPLSRALDTAKIIAETNRFSSSDIVIVTELKEKSAGSLELAPLQQIFEKSEEEFKQLGGENAQMFQERVRKALNIIYEIGKNHNSVLVVAHSGIYKMAKVLHDNLQPATRMYDIDIPKNADLLEMPMIESDL